MRFAPRVAACWLLLTSPVAAQSLELRLRDEATRAPIAGAIVRLIRNDTALVPLLGSSLLLASQSLAAQAVVTGTVREDSTGRLLAAVDVIV